MPSRQGEPAEIRAERPQIWADRVTQIDAPGAVRKRDGRAGVAQTLRAPY